MKRPSGYMTLAIAILLSAMGWTACSSVPEPKKSSLVTAAKASTSTAVAAKKSKNRAVQVEGVASFVGQRTVILQVERKGRVREEVVGVDDKAHIEKSGNKANLANLKATDKTLIAYEPEAYTPALSIEVMGVGKIQKVGGDD